MELPTYVLASLFVPLMLAGLLNQKLEKLVFPRFVYDLARADLFVFSLNFSLKILRSWEMNICQAWFNWTFTKMS